MRLPSGTTPNRGRNTYRREGDHDRYRERPLKKTQRNIRERPDVVPMYFIIMPSLRLLDRLVLRLRRHRRNPLQRALRVVLSRIPNLGRRSNYTDGRH